METYAHMTYIIILIVCVRSPAFCRLYLLRTKKKSIIRVKLPNVTHPIIVNLDVRYISVWCVCFHFMN